MAITKRSISGSEKCRARSNKSRSKESPGCCPGLRVHNKGEWPRGNEPLDASILSQGTNQARRGSRRRAAAIVSSYDHVSSAVTRGISPRGRHRRPLSVTRGYDGGVRRVAMAKVTTPFTAEERVILFCAATGISPIALGITAHAMQSMAIKGFIVHNRETGDYALTDSRRATGP